jgi:hypothetical protein
MEVLGWSRLVRVGDEHKKARELEMLSRQEGQSCVLDNFYRGQLCCGTDIRTRPSSSPRRARSAHTEAWMDLVRSFGVAGGHTT